jgi:hypothetical protein
MKLRQCARALVLLRSGWLFVVHGGGDISGHMEIQPGIGGRCIPDECGGAGREIQRLRGPWRERAQIGDSSSGAARGDGDGDIAFVLRFDFKAAILATAEHKSFTGGHCEVRVQAAARGQAGTAESGEQGERQGAMTQIKMTPEGFFRRGVVDSKFMTP